MASYKVSQNANCKRRRERFAELHLFLQMLGRRANLFLQNCPLRHLHITFCSTQLYHLQYTTPITITNFLEKKIRHVCPLAKI